MHSPLRTTIFRQMFSRILLLTVVLGGAVALAQDAGSTDGSLPDGSVGMGGSEQNTQEMGDGTENTVCATNNNCSRGFTCNANHCHYSGTKVAGGCGGGAMAALVFPLVVALVWRRRGAAGKRS